MIIGNGDIASVLPGRDDLVFFASGVSNSQETRDSEFQREIYLLDEQDRNKRLVYFSSLSIFYSETKYSKFKKEMEHRVRMMFPFFTIVRIGNITWGTNPHTLINHFKEMAKSCEPLDIQDTTRYMVEKDEFLHWINLIPNWNCEMNIPGRIMTIQQIVDTYVAPDFI